jgi:hypothetical protein
MTEACSCALHKEHKPMNLTVEQHHILPQAWQRFWVPPGATISGKALLWDPRTVTLCPTGHRNVHALIVRVMKQVAAQGNEDILAAVHAAGVAHSYPTGKTALLALERFTAAGGKLLELTAAREWGEA